MEVAEFMTKEVAKTDPNWTLVAPRKPVPVRVTRVSPVVVPEVTSRALTLGAEGAAKVYWLKLEVAEVPAGVVTVT
jgi:hypothetical protein